jgi:hypothetical protein
MLVHLINLNIKSLGSDIQRRIIFAVNRGAGFTGFNKSNLNGATVRL